MVPVRQCHGIWKLLQSQCNAILAWKCESNILFNLAQESAGECWATKSGRAEIFRGPEARGRTRGALEGNEVNYMLFWGDLLYLALGFGVPIVLKATEIINAICAILGLHVCCDDRLQ